MIPDDLDSLSEFEIASLFRMLDPVERTILKMRFGILESEPHTLEEVGDTLGLPGEFVKKTEIKAMSKLGWIEIVE